MMLKYILFIIGILFLFISINNCQPWNDTDSIENVTEIIPPKPFVYYGRYHQRRLRREYSYQNATSYIDTFGTIFSILPLDRLGSILGQIMATSLKELFNPNVGKKILNILQDQAPPLLTSLLTNILNTFRVSIRSFTGNITLSINKNITKPFSNSSTSTLMNFIRRSHIQVE